MSDGGVQSVPAVKILPIAVKVTVRKCREITALAIYWRVRYLLDVARIKLRLFSA